MTNYKNQMQGARNRAAGKLFEDDIMAACAVYRQEGVAKIDKTPESTKVIGRNTDGSLKLVFDKKAQPDFKGIMCGGRSIVFDAKHTDKDRVLQSAITVTQAQHLEASQSMGALCYVLVSIGVDFYNTFMVPWGVWRNMKSIYGRKYIKSADVEQYRVEQKFGVLRFLESIPHGE